METSSMRGRGRAAPALVLPTHTRIRALFRRRFGFRFKAQGSGLRAQGSRLRAQGSRHTAHDLTTHGAEGYNPFRSFLFMTSMIISKLRLITLIVAGAAATIYGQSSPV